MGQARNTDLAMAAEAMLDPGFREGQAAQVGEVMPVVLALGAIGALVLGAVWYRSRS